VSTIITRQSKAVPLTYAEVDQNFINLNADKTENSAAAITGGTINGTSIGAIAPSTGKFTSLEVFGTAVLGTPLGLSSGGTGASTANDALTNLVPVGEAIGYVLSTNGRGSYFWASPNVNITYETIASNLSEYPYTLSYDLNGRISSVVYTTPTSTITKVYNYVLDVLASVVISGPTLQKSYIKTLNYTAGALTGVSYS
jgi:hypothetical protein